LTNKCKHSVVVFAGIVYVCGCVRARARACSHVFTHAHVGMHAHSSITDNM